MEGGCYPSGGSEALAEELVPVIESYGGKVLIRALVDSILVESMPFLRYYVI
jgi:phytoene dehydrogenase-like protein